MAKQGILTTADCLPIEEYKKLVQGLHEKELYFWELYCRAQFCTGLRFSDVQRLTWSDLLSNKRLAITELKTQKGRLIVKSDFIRAKFHELWELSGKPDKQSLILLNSATGKAYSSQRVNQVIKRFIFDFKLVDRSNNLIEHLSTHTLRKTFGRWVYLKKKEENATNDAIVFLMRIFNHSSPQITLEYIGIIQDDIDDVFMDINF